MVTSAEQRELILSLAAVARERLDRYGLPHYAVPTPEQMRRFTNRIWEREQIALADDYGHVYPPYSMSQARKDAREHVRVWQRDIRDADALPTSDKES